MKFSLAISPYSAVHMPIDEGLIAALETYKSRIFDINFTARVEPFNTDAHGIPLSLDDAQSHLVYCLEIQKKTGITVSAIFNNILVSTTIDNLNVFCDSLQGLYDQGLRSVTLPHSIWMKTGMLQERFPDLRIKNTVLRKTRTAQDFFNFASMGFDYVNLDRILWRDLDTLKEIKTAQRHFKKKTGKLVYTSMLIGEGCQGDCPLFDEHYQYTLAMTEAKGFCEKKANHPIMKLPIVLSGCNDNISILSRTGPSPFKQDLNTSCDFVDVIKLAGRHDKYVLKKHIAFINDFSETCSQLTTKAIADCYRPIIFSEDNVELFSEWRKTIRNCKYQCWKCDICQKTQINLMKQNQLENI